MQNHAPSLDIDAVRAFALVADLSSFTRAAQASDTTQSAVSLKLKRLETRLGLRLVERTPRSVRLTSDGVSFLARARELLSAHDRALSGAEAPERRLTIGFSDHASGPDLPRLLAKVNAFDEGLHLDVRIGYSRVVLEAYDAGKLDAVVALQDKGRRGGEKLVEDRFGWFATPAFRQRAGEKLRLAMLAEPCVVRAQALRALERADIPWTEAFTGGGVAAIAAAVSAGLAVSPLAERVAPPGTIDVGPALGLPALGHSTVMLHSRVSDARARAALRTLAAAFRSTAVAR
jgi:DNA-binding transcriptional LysR family regulator